MDDEAQKLPVTPPDVSSGVINDRPTGQVPGGPPLPMGTTAAPEPPSVSTGATSAIHSKPLGRLLVPAMKDRRAATYAYVRPRPVGRTVA
jgi:hypothetical protein